MISLLFQESPVIGSFFLISSIVLFYYKCNNTASLFLITLLLLLLFYRYEPHQTNYADNVIISPAQGTITNIKYNNNHIYVSIFMSIFNNHTQIYPVNGTVINRIYDRTGKFNIVVNQEKSRYNEKKIHNIIMKNKKLITITQIAGFLPRCITSSDIVSEKVRAGQYLGMIKFGSRIDIIFPGNISKLKLKVNDTINIGDSIYTY